MASDTISRARPLRTMLQAVCLTLPLGGCLLTGELPEPGLAIPALYDQGPRNTVAAHAALPSLDWWRGFRSRELTEIIENTREANLEIAAAVARIVQADAQSRIAGAPLLPSIDLGGSAARSRSPQGSSIGAGGGSVNDSFATSLSASYEIDFWGKNRAALRAAEQSAVAFRFDSEVVGLTVVASAANAYFQMLAAQDRLQVARNNLQSANRVLNLIQQRVTAGTASDLDTAQQESLANSQRASIPPLEQTVTQNRNALAVLMGRSPEGLRIRGGSLRAISIPRVTPGLPSELLAQRPDIRVAEANLAAANANVDVARAQMLPSIRLTGEGGYQSAVFRSLLRPESAFYNLAAGLTQPIFDGFALQGNLDQQKGRQDELLQNYRQRGDLRPSPMSRTRSTPSASRPCGNASSARWCPARSAPSTFRKNACAAARSISSPCCRRSRRSIRPRTVWRRPAWRTCRRLSAFIRRSVAAGCRGPNCRSKPPMHGELPKQVLTQRSRSKRRYYALGLVLIVAASALVYYFATPAQQQKQGRRFAEGGGAVPVLAAVVSNADVPVYLDAVGTIRALNTVTVKPQVDGKLLEIAFKEGQAVKRGDVLARIDPTTYKAPARSGAGQEGPGRSAADQCPKRSGALRAAARQQRHQPPAIRHPAVAGRAIYRAGAGRSGGHRKRAGDAGLHHHPRADRRPHRHPAGRRRQHRARLRRQRHRRHHRGAADLGVLQSAAAGTGRGQQRVRQGAAGGRRAALRQ